jgi:hypothetical protein
MHAAELVDLAGVIATHASALVNAAHSLPTVELERYWTACRCRIDRWGLALAAVKDERADRVDVRAVSSNHWPLIDEILSGEILTRVWAAILAKHDLKHGITDGEPIGSSVQLAHIEIRFRTMSLFSDARHFPLSDVVRLNRLRRQCERWTDVLLAQMSPIGDLAAYAHDIERMRDYADSAKQAQPARAEQVRWSLLLTSLHAAFERSMRHSSPNDDLNRQIAAGILGCYQPELFDGSGVLRAAWVSRLTTIVDDAETIVDEYLAASHSTSSENQKRRLRRFN